MHGNQENAHTSEVALQLLFITGAMFGVVLRKHAGYVHALQDFNSFHSKNAFREILEGDLRTWSIVSMHPDCIYMSCVLLWQVCLDCMTQMTGSGHVLASCQFSILLYYYCVVTGEITLTTKLSKPIPGDSCVTRRLTNTK